MKTSPKKRKISAKKQPPRSRRVIKRTRAMGKYLPALIISILATTLSLQPQAFLPSNDQNVLAYATNTSVSGLLSATNTQRSNYGKSSLKLHSKLNSAAQAKANDMVARNYWSHVTPDGKQPWWFITNAGYNYTAAGENLAYGFMSSGDTVTGWMNSPSHKANLLSGNYTEVGFGIANSASYVGNGKQTIVVAMYAKPVSSTPAPAPVTTKPKSAVKSAPAPSQTLTEPEPEPETEPNKKEVKETDEETIVTTQTEPTTPVDIRAAPAQVSRVQLLTRGNAIWSASFVTLLVVSVGLFWLIHKGIHLKRYILAGEHFFAHHIHLDFTVLTIIYLGFVLLSSSGVIR